jgi:hypothetical protein
VGIRFHVSGVLHQWEVRYPWASHWELLNAQTNAELLWTNADLWEDGTLLGLSVSNAAGEMLWHGPTTLSVYPLAMRLPAPANTSGLGPAERYPATLNVHGEPTNDLSRVEVTLHNLRHSYPADLDILLVSPAGAKIMLMSHAGGSIAVSNATLVFHPASQGYPIPPQFGPISSNGTNDYSIVNYADPGTSVPGAPSAPYPGTVDALPTTDSNPNGFWRLYIYDHKLGGTGVLQDSWGLSFYYP